jgi:hypothetical protein
MKKRFSWIAFVVATVSHLYVTSLLVSAGFSADKAIEHGQSQQSFFWLTVWAWIWQPLVMFASYYTRHHPPAVKPGIFETGPSPTVFILPWTILVGVCFGFLVPRIWQWVHRSSNQSMQRTAGRSDA